jgi:hypothetical protein
MAQPCRVCALHISAAQRPEATSGATAIVAPERIRDTDAASAGLGDFRGP